MLCIHHESKLLNGQMITIYIGTSTEGSFSFLPLNLLTNYALQLYIYSQEM